MPTGPVAYPNNHRPESCILTQYRLKSNGQRISLKRDTTKYQNVRTRVNVIYSVIPLCIATGAEGSSF